MPTDVLKVSGDYLLDASNGNITLDVTNDTTTGTVTILGNLNVVGISANISTIDSIIKDNILILNSEENYQDTHGGAAGITLGTSGLLISRGYYDSPAFAATMLYRETDVGDWTSENNTIHNGIFEFTSGSMGSAIKTSGIRVDNASTATLNIFGVDNPLAVISVSGTSNYEEQVRAFGDDAIPNKKYVDDALYLGTNFAKELLVGGTFLKLEDQSIRPTSDPFYGPVDRIFAGLGTSTNVVFDLYGTSALIQGITIDSTTINANTSTDLVLQPMVGNAVKVKEALKITQISTGTALTPESNTDTLYYTGNPGGGGTGLYYVNTDQSDELVSRRKAIIYGIIF